MANTSATGGFLTPTTPPPTYDLALARPINNLIAGATGIAGNLVRPRYQLEPIPTPGPAVNWASYGVTSIDPIGFTPVIEHVPTGNGHDELRREEEITVLFSFYGPMAEFNAALTRDGLNIAQNWEDAYGFELKFGEIGGIISTAEQVNNQWYKRADMEIRVRRQVNRAYDILNVLSAKGVNHGAGSAPDIQAEWNTENH